MDEELRQAVEELLGRAMSMGEPDAWVVIEYDPETKRHRVFGGPWTEEYALQKRQELQAENAKLEELANVEVTVARFHGPVPTIDEAHITEEWRLFWRRDGVDRRWIHRPRFTARDRTKALELLRRSRAQASDPRVRFKLRRREVLTVRSYGPSEDVDA